MKEILLANRLLKIDGKTYGIGDRLPANLSLEFRDRFVAKRWVSIIAVVSAETPLEPPLAKEPALEAAAPEPTAKPSRELSVAPEIPKKRNRKKPAATTGVAAKE